MTVDKMALEQRRNDIRDLIMVPGEKVNIDMLMDVLGNGSFVFSPIIMVSILTLWTDDVFLQMNTWPYSIQAIISCLNENENHNTR